MFMVHVVPMSCRNIKCQHLLLVTGPDGEERHVNMGDTFGLLSCCVWFRRQKEGTLRNKQILPLIGRHVSFSVTPVYPLEVGPLMPSLLLL